MVLGAVAGGALAAHRFIQAAAEHRQVADVVDGHQVFRRIVRLEMPHPGSPGGLFKEGLVAVGKVRPGFGQGFAHAEHRVGGQHVVVVGQGQIVPAGQGGGRVGVGRDAAVPDLAVEDAAVLRGPLLRHAAHLGVGFVAGVRQHQLPVGGRLGLHAVQELLQKAGRRVVQRGQDADGGPVCGALRRLGPLGFQRLFGGQIPRPLAEEPPLEKACGPGGHDPYALFPGEGAGVAEQFPDAFCFQAHGVNRAGPRPAAPYFR